MDAVTRLAAVSEVERTLQKLVDKGWRVQEFNSFDEENEPFRVQVILRIDRTKFKGLI